MRAERRKKCSNPAGPCSGKLRADAGNAGHPCAGRSGVSASFAACLLSFLLVFSLLASPAAGAIPPAGQVISSRSTATYDENGTERNVFSNQVLVTVLPVYGPLLVPSGTTDDPAGIRRAFSGETVSFPFRLGNSGNETDSYELGIVPVSPSDFVAASAQVYLDADRDSLLDPGETVVTAAGPLAPGEDVALLLVAELPLGLAGGEAAHIDLTARSTADTSAVDRGNVVRIIAREEARVTILLSSDVTAVLPGEEIGFSIDFVNIGERAAENIVITDYIDFNGICTGTELIHGSEESTVPGLIEYYRVEFDDWIDISPLNGFVKGIRLRIAGLEPGEGGTFSFRVRVNDDRQWGQVLNVAETDYMGGDSRLYHMNSNEVVVAVGRVSALSIGPLGDPTAGDIQSDCVVVTLSGSDTSCVFWHEVLNAGNYTDTVDVILADSLRIPVDWHAEFLDSTGSRLPATSPYSARLGALPRDRTARVGLYLQATPESFRLFTGREFDFDVVARSLVVASSQDSVRDVLVKTDLPIISVKQSIREPTALIGDILSFIVTVENMTAETPVDSITLVEVLSPGLGFAGGSAEPEISGNMLSWPLPALDPGERYEIVFRARVKAGQEWGRLVSNAWVYGRTQFGEETTDGPSAASIVIVEGIFTRRGIIMGAVFADGDADGVMDSGEHGISGVSVFMEDGTYAVTDSLGFYSIPGVLEGTHVVRVDPATLPDSLEPADAGYFGLGTPGQLLIELAPSGNRRADFPLQCCTTISKGEPSAALGGTAPAVAHASSGPEMYEYGAAGAADSGSDRSDAAAGEVPRNDLDSANAVGKGYPDAGANRANTGKRLDANDAGDPSTAPGKDGHGAAATSPGLGFDAFTITSTQFMPSSAVLEEIPLKQIAALVLWLMDHSGWKIFIAGHTDSIPISTAEFPSNFELSLARARTVSQLLRMNGVPAERMDYTGYGARMPVAANDTPEGRALNRRVEIRVMPPDDYDGDDPGLPEMLNRPDATIGLAGGETPESGGPGQAIGGPPVTGEGGSIGGTLVFPGTQEDFLLAGESGICADIVKPEEGHVFYTRDAIDVEIISPLASRTELYVNSVPVGAEQIGQKRVDIKEGTITVIFYGVKIREGRSDILVLCRQYGGERAHCVRHVYLAGKPSGIVPESEEVRVPADGKTAPEAVFLVRDRSGLPVRDGLFATVTGPADLLEGLDENPHASGIQVGTKNGRVRLPLNPSRESRREKIHVKLDGLAAGCRIAYESSLRDWFVLGYGEGEIGYSNLTGAGSTHRSIERHRDGLFAEGKLAFYGQGEVRGGHLLTCAIDTRPFREDRLFRRIEPEKYYPVYGDAGELKFNAASRSGTFIRLDNRRYSAMFGDFRTELGRTEFTKYHRSFNGLEGEARLGRVTARSFITRTDQVTYQEEIPADGTSGFYFLENYPLIESSEKIRIEVRDRYRPERILRVDYKQVNRDYDINYTDGTILFKEPVPANDDDFNPVTIVISYECRNAGEYNFIYGMRTSVGVRDSLAVGVTTVLEEEGVENSSLVGIDVSGLLCGGVGMEAEYAHSEKFVLGGGNAFRLKFMGRHEETVTWNAYYREIDQNFFNPSFTGGKTELGSMKFGGDLDWRMSRAFSVRAKGYRHDLRERDERKGYADLLFLYRTSHMRGKIGLAGASHSDTRDGDQSAMLLLAGIGTERGRTSIELQWDQILTGEEVQEYPNRIQAKLSQKLWKAVSATLRHEYRTGSRTGTRHLTQVGLESRITEDLHLFSRYRLEGAMSGERGQATVGLENRFRLADDLTATLSVEKASTVSGVQANDFTAIATGWVYTPAEKDYRLKGDYEIRLEPDRRKHLAGLAGLKRLGLRWAGLAKGDLWFSDEKRESNRVKGGSTVGLSMRPKTGGPLTLLSLLEANYEKNSPAHPGGVDRSLTASLEANYRLRASWELEGKVAGRWVKNTFKAYTASASTFLYQAHIIRTFGMHWDAGLTGRIVHQVETGTVRYGGGVEIGRRVAKNLWLGLGYDIGGHDDADSPVNEFQRSGFHIRLRMKFDEKLMRYFYGSKE